MIVLQRSARNNTPSEGENFRIEYIKEIRDLPGARKIRKNDRRWRRPNKLRDQLKYEIKTTKNESFENYLISWVVWRMTKPLLRSVENN